MYAASFTLINSKSVKEDFVVVGNDIEQFCLTCISAKFEAGRNIVEYQATCQLGKPPDIFIRSKLRGKKPKTNPVHWKPAVIV